MVSVINSLVCPFTGSNEFKKVFEYNEPPKGEIIFNFNNNKAYHREIWQCQVSNHYLSIHEMDMSDMYNEDYVSSTYQDLEGIRKTFQKIIALPPNQSDNVGRTNKVVEIVNNYYGNANSKTILDVGAGLGVFPYTIKQQGWDCTALDPDSRAAAHMREHIGVEVIQGDFMEVDTEKKFDVITFNKVLEHIDDPIKMLAKSKDYLKKDGIVYIELPDGEIAANDGKGREEFFIDHIHIFSMSSMIMLANLAGFHPFFVERLKEPSTKYTLRAFLIQK